MPPSNKAQWIEANESGNWNVAALYANYMVFRPLYELLEYEKVAEFGVSDFIDDLVTTPASKSSARAKALVWYHRTLLSLIDNTQFALKTKDKPRLDELRKQLKELKGILPLCYRTVINQKLKRSEVLIEEDKFAFVLQLLIDTKKDLLEPINRGDLIFTSVDEIDPDELKKRIAEDMIHSG